MRRGLKERELNRDPMEGKGGEAFKYDGWSWWGGEGEITWGRTRECRQTTPQR